MALFLLVRLDPAAWVSLCLKVVWLALDRPDNRPVETKRQSIQPRAMPPPPPSAGAQGTIIVLDAQTGRVRAHA